PEVFDKVYTNMVAAGESSGNLNHILTRLSAMTRQSDRLRSRIIAAMIYPTLLTTISISVLCVLIFFVLPRFEAVFEDMNVDLPGSTKALLAVSNTVRNHMLFTIFSVAAVVTGAIYWLRTEHGRRFVMRYSLRVPVAGPLICSINMSRLLRLLGLMVDSSIPLLESLELTAAATKNYLYAELMEKLRANDQDYRASYQKIASRISKLRRDGAKKLAQQINTQLKVLGMPHASLEVTLRPVTSDNPVIHGLESVEFLVSTNPGQDAKPLIKIASGGELSRISLAIQVITAQTSQTPSLVFDEVDVGIGGGVARSVGELLRRLGKSTQILCVTHQAQVAGQGHHHLFVSKINTGRSTLTQIEELTNQAKVKEIARMLGGEEYSVESLAHAEQMVASN
ncbi:MAG: type II secretion system F family protein, partial [Proteobacteria bacterium]|nr:type II secretion system F family protein [Pseudomonadota bacterium]